MHNLILWNDASKKWQDVGNDYWCKQDYSGKWVVTARYGFSDGDRFVEFDTEPKAMEFFVNFLYRRQMNFIEGEK